MPRAMLPDGLRAPLMWLHAPGCADWRVPAAWQRALLWLSLAWLALGLLFRSDWTAMAAQWWDISTYNHILLIPLILAWLVHQRLAGLARLEPSGWWPGLALFAGAVMVWVLGAFAGIAIIRQFAAVGMLIAALLALLGPRVSAGLAFPLGYMLLLVPFGEELVPQLQMITAAMTVALVHLTGIQASINGVFIDTPAGLFEVAEACSGVKFLIAMVAFGILAANVCFLSWRRRLAFMAMALAVPILANSLRAWGTIFAAQYVGVERAAGIDHIIYGWVFFGLVIAATLALAWRFFDRPAGDQMIDADAIAVSPWLGRAAALRIGAKPALAGLAALALGGIVWAAAADRLTAPLPAIITLPEVPGWNRVDYAPRAWWEPRASGADHRLLGRYADGHGQQVDVFLALYSAQGQGRRASGFGQGALPPQGGWAWLKPGPDMAAGKSDVLLGPGRVERSAITFYRSGDLLTGSGARLSLANMQDRLLLRKAPTVMLILSAEKAQGKPASAALGAFRQSTGPLGPWMDRIVALR